MTKFQIVKCGFALLLSVGVLSAHATTLRTFTAPVVTRPFYTSETTASLDFLQTWSGAYGLVVANGSTSGLPVGSVFFSGNLTTATTTQWAQPLQVGTYFVATSIPRDQQTSPTLWFTTTTGDWSSLSFATIAEKCTSTPAAWTQLFESQPAIAHAKSEVVWAGAGCAIRVVLGPSPTIQAVPTTAQNLLLAPAPMEPTKAVSPSSSMFFWVAFANSSRHFNSTVRNNIGEKWDWMYHSSLQSFDVSSGIVSNVTTTAAESNQFMGSPSICGNRLLLLEGRALQIYTQQQSGELEKAGNPIALPWWIHDNRFGRMERYSASAQLAATAPLSLGNGNIVLVDPELRLHRFRDTSGLGTYTWSGEQTFLGDSWTGNPQDTSAWNYVTVRKPVAYVPADPASVSYVVLLTSGGISCISIPPTSSPASPAQAWRFGLVARGEAVGRPQGDPSGNNRSCDTLVEPIIFQGVVYAVCEGKMMAFDLQQGNVLAEGPSVTAGAKVDLSDAQTTGNIRVISHVGSSVVQTNLGNVSMSSSLGASPGELVTTGDCSSLVFSDVGNNTDVTTSSGNESTSNESSLGGGDEGNLASPTIGEHILRFLIFPGWIFIVVIAVVAFFIIQRRKSTFSFSNRRSASEDTEEGAADMDEVKQKFLAEEEDAMKVILNDGDPFAMHDDARSEALTTSEAWENGSIGVANNSMGSNVGGYTLHNGSLGSNGHAAHLNTSMNSNMGYVPPNNNSMSSNVGYGLNSSIGSNVGYGLNGSLGSNVGYTLPDKVEEFDVDPRTVLPIVNVPLGLRIPFVAALDTVMHLFRKATSGVKNKEVVVMLTDVAVNVCSLKGELERSTKYGAIKEVQVETGTNTVAILTDGSLGDFDMLLRFNTLPDQEETPEAATESLVTVLTRCADFLKIKPLLTVTRTDKINIQDLQLAATRPNWRPVTVNVPKRRISLFESLKAKQQRVKDQEAAQTTEPGLRTRLRRKHQMDPRTKLHTVEIPWDDFDCTGSYQSFSKLSDFFLHVFCMVRDVEGKRSALVVTDQSVLVYSYEGALKRCFNIDRLHGLVTGNDESEELGFRVPNPEFDVVATFPTPEQRIRTQRIVETLYKYITKDRLHVDKAPGKAVDLTMFQLAKPARFKVEFLPQTNKAEVLLAETFNKGTPGVVVPIVTSDNDGRKRATSFGTAVPTTITPVEPARSRATSAAVVPTAGGGGPTTVLNPIVPHARTRRATTTTSPVPATHLFPEWKGRQRSLSTAAAVPVPVQIRDVSVEETDIL